MAVKISNAKARELGIERHIPVGPLGTHTLDIEGWTPPSVNLLWKKHWAVGHKLKREAADRVRVAQLAGDGPVPVATTKRRVSVFATVPNHAPDPDNILKVLLDALKANGLILDDSAAWLKIGDVAVERGKERRTVVILEDIR